MWLAAMARCAKPSPPVDVAVVTERYQHRLRVFAIDAGDEKIGPRSTVTENTQGRARVRRYA